ncbi:MAG: hypothetical protein WA672_10690 [Candidatus Angelobacter sp.]
MNILLSGVQNKDEIPWRRSSQVVKAEFPNFNELTVMLWHGRTQAKTRLSYKKLDFVFKLVSAASSCIAPFSAT